MTTQTLDLSRGFAPVDADARVRRTGRGLLHFIFDAIAEAERRSTEKRVADYIEQNGGRLTDDLERRISQRFGSAVF